MATSIEASRRAGAPAGAEDRGFLATLIAWIHDHRQAASYLGLGVLVAGGLFWWNALSARRSEAVAGQQLNQARVALESGNLPLAASEFARITENYAGTHAAQEAMLLLAQTRLRQGQSEQAIELLRNFAPGADAAYRAQAYGLLGAAYENVGRPAQAAVAYDEAARHAELPYLAGQYLSDAARAWTAAGDTAKAVASYQRIIEDYAVGGPVMEARVRLGELTKGAGVP